MSIPSYRLIHPKGDLSACRCLLLAELTGVDVKSQQPSHRDNEAVITASSPLGRLPVLITPQGNIWGSVACGRYLSSIRRDMALLGQSPMETAKVDMWISLCCVELAPPLYCLSNIADCCETACKPEQARHEVLRVVDVVEKRLLSHTYLASEAITMADVWMLVSLQDAENNIADVAQRLADCPSINRWMHTLTNFKAIKKQLKAFNLEKRPPPAKIAEGNDEESEEDPPKKDPNPLDLLPPSSMVLDMWKREYSNSDDLQGKSMKWFWDHLDREGYTLWYMKYDKLEGECEKAFLTSNLLAGFLQRIEPNFRKYSFGVVDVVEDTSDSFEIAGVWVIRGQELPRELKEHVQSESFIFTKLDSEDVKHKKLVEDYWCSEKVEGKKVASSSVWK